MSYGRHGVLCQVQREAGNQGRASGDDEEWSGGATGYLSRLWHAPEPHSTWCEQEIRPRGSRFFLLRESEGVARPVASPPRRRPLRPPALLRQDGPGVSSRPRRGGVWLGCSLQGSGLPASPSSLAGRLAPSGAVRLKVAAANALKEGAILFVEGDQLKIGAAAGQRVEKGEARALASDSTLNNGHSLHLLWLRPSLERS